MPQDPNRLIWIDLEMTGLKPETDRILEIALVVTDHELETVAQAPVYVIHQDNSTLEAMDSWNKSTHGRSGLIHKVRAANAREPEVEMAALAFLREHVPAKASPLWARYGTRLDSQSAREVLAPHHRSHEERSGEQLVDEREVDVGIELTTVDVALEHLPHEGASRHEVAAAALEARGAAKL